MLQDSPLRNELLKAITQMRLPFVFETGFFSCMGRARQRGQARIMIGITQFCKQGHVARIDPDAPESYADALKVSACWCGEPAVVPVFGWGVDPEAPVPLEPLDEIKKPTEINGKTVMMPCPLFDVSAIFQEA